MRNMWKLVGDPSRCDNRMATSAIATSGIATNTTSTVTGVITAPTRSMSMLELVRRKPFAKTDPLRDAYTVVAAPNVNAERARDMTVVQDYWAR